MRKEYTSGSTKNTLIFQDADRFRIIQSITKNSGFMGGEAFTESELTIERFMGKDLLGNEQWAKWEPEGFTERQVIGWMKNQLAEFATDLDVPFRTREKDEAAS